MTIRFACPRCSRNYAVPDKAAGKRTRCPACRDKLTIPSPPRDAGRLWFSCPRCARVFQISHASGTGQAFKCLLCCVPLVPGRTTPEADDHRLDKHCPNCRTGYRMTRDMDGWRLTCPDCGAVLHPGCPSPLRDKPPSTWEGAGTRLSGMSMEDVGAAVGLGLAALVVILTVGLYLFVPAANRKPSITRDSYESVQPLMTYREVEQRLGPPTHTQYTDSGYKIVSWQDGNQEIAVEFFQGSWLDPYKVKQKHKQGL